MANAIIVGEWRYSQYEHGFSRALEALGVKVRKFSLVDHKIVPNRLSYLFPCDGSTSRSIHENVVSFCQSERVDFVLFWRPTHVLPETLREINRLGALTVSYNNDDPFSKTRFYLHRLKQAFFWRLYTKCLPHFSFNFFYRPINCTEAKSFGAHHADVLLPYFLPWQDHPIELNDAERELYDADVAFVGHFENDNRHAQIASLIDAGFCVKVWSGHRWPELKGLSNSIRPVLGSEYTKALTGAKVCLSFLSKLNRDTYTRRCFEIPACRKAMVSERTLDLVRFFDEERDALFFNDTRQMIKNVEILIDRDGYRDQVAQNGYERVWRDGHDVISRASEFLTRIGVPHSAHSGASAVLPTSNSPKNGHAAN